MASLAELLLGKDNPVTQWTGRNSNLLTGLGTSLLSDGMNFQPAQVGATLDRQAAAQKEADAKLAATKNYTVNWLRQKAPDIADMIDAGALAPSDGFQMYTDRQNAKVSGNEYQDRFTAGQQYGLSGSDLNTFALTGALPGTNKQNVTYGVTPIYGTDSATGKTGMGVQGSDGSFKLVDTGGFQPLGPYDLNAQKAAGSAFGKNTGGAQFDLPAAKLTTDQTLAAIADVRANERGLDEQFSMGGLQQMTPAWPGSEKAKFQVANNRLTNRAFLEAREVLRGGGQITDFESRKAEGAITNIEDAMARGDKALYLKALADFEDAVKAGYAKLEAQASTMSSYGGQPATAAGGNAYTVLKVE